MSQTGGTFDSTPEALRERIRVENLKVATSASCKDMLRSPQRSQTDTFSARLRSPQTSGMYANRPMTAATSSTNCAISPYPL